jgi:hypothetical protein
MLEPFFRLPIRKTFLHMSKTLFYGSDTMCAHIAQLLNRLEAYGWTVLDVVLYKITGFP